MRTRAVRIAYKAACGVFREPPLRDSITAALGKLSNNTL